MLRISILLLLLVSCAPALAVPPMIQWSTPSNQATYSYPASINVQSSAITLENESITNHRILVNGQPRFDSNHEVLNHVVTGLQPGTYSFQVTAKVNTGEQTSAAPRTIIVLPAGAQLPTITLNAPTGSPFIAPATVNLSATASDPDGSVVKVEFFRDGAMIGTDTTPPSFTATWSNAPAGTYSLTARATDNTGNTKTSAAQPLIVSLSEIKGNIDSVGEASGVFYINGWACSTGRNEPVNVHVYVGGPAGTGTGIANVMANVSSEAAVATACQASGTHYRFHIPISGQHREAHANKLIYVHGISPVGAGNPTINNSGVHRVPPPLRIGRHYYYDDQQRLCRSVEPETGSTVYDYDAAGNLAWTAAGLYGASFPTDGSCRRAEALASGRVVQRSYDARNRLETLRFPDQRGDQDWVYYPDGLPQQVTTVNVPGAVHPINQYVYNRRRLLKTETQHLPAWYSYSLGYTYDANAGLKKLHYPSGMAVDFAPNALGQPTQAVGSWIGGTQAFASGITYHPNGAIAQFNYGNGITHEMIPNDRQLPDTVRSYYGATNVHYDAYDYDANGNVAAISDGIGSGPGNRTMTYDGLDRLTKVEGPMYAASGGQAAYRYNGVDDVVEVVAPGRHHFYCYDGARRLTNLKEGGCTGTSVSGFGYDAAGNVSNHDGQLFDFDYGNRLREVMGVERYRYDANGRRILAMSFNQGIVLSQYGQDGKLYYQNNSRTGVMRETDHIYLGNSLIAQRDVPVGGGVPVFKYQHTDALGSPVVVTGQGKNEIERAKYEPYGRQLTTLANTGNDRPGFTGHVEDRATGLTYMQQRYYDAEVGRFLSVDPVTASSDPVAMFNRYRYGANNPYRFVDPDGRQHYEMSDSFAELGSHVAYAIQNRQYRNMPSGPAKSAMARHLAASHVALYGDSRAAQRLRLEADSIDGAPLGVIYRRIDPKTGDTYIGRANSPEHFTERQRDHDRNLKNQHVYDVLQRAEPGRDLEVAEETQIRRHGGPRGDGGGLVNGRHEMRDSRYRAAGGREPPPLGTRIRRR